MRPQNWLAAILAVILFHAGVCSFRAQGSEPPYPPWWYTQGVVSGGTLNDYGAANIGQAKNFTLAAIAELDADLSQFGGAGPLLDGTAAWLLSNETNNVAGLNDFAAINLGQLKYLTKPIYDRLLAIGYAAGPLSTGTYPWLVSGHGAVNDYAAANIGQLKLLFSFDPSYSSTGDSIPDWWKVTYSLGSTVSYSTNVPWSAGQLTYGQAYSSGINPVDYFAGTQGRSIQGYTLTDVSGAGQTGTAGGFVSLPILVAMSDSNNNPLAYAPVVFRVPIDDGSALQASSTATPAASGTLLTDGNGYAQIYYRLPNSTASTTGTVTVTSGTASQSLLEYIDPTSTHYYASPFAPSHILKTPNNDGTVTYTWQNNDSASFIYVYSYYGGTWNLISTLDPGTTSYTVPESYASNQTQIGNSYSPGGSTGAPPSGSGGYSGNTGNGTGNGNGGNGIANAPPGPGGTGFEPIPTQNYAAIDMSGATPSGNPVSAVAVDDHGNGAFGFSASSAFNVYTWSNGTASSKQSLALTGAAGSKTYSLVPNLSFQLGQTIFGISSSGGLWWGTTEETDGSVPGTDFPSIITSAGTYAGSQVYPPDPPFGHSPDTPWLEPSLAIASAAPGNLNIFCGTAQGTETINDQNGNPTHQSVPRTGIVGNSGNLTVFSTHLDTAGSATLQNNDFFPQSINDNGWAIGQDGVTGQVELWDRSQVRSLPGVAFTINNANRILGDDGDTTYAFSAEFQEGSANGYIWTSANGEQFISQLLPSDYLNEVWSIAPVAISGTDSSGNVKVLLHADYQVDESGNSAEGLLMLTLDSQNKPVSLKVLHWPSNVTDNMNPDNLFYSSGVAVNNQGMISGIGDILFPGPNGTTTTGYSHALLLCSVEITARDGMINEGFDPPLTGDVDLNGNKDEDDWTPWTRVSTDDVFQDNELTQLVSPSANIANMLEVVPADDSADLIDVTTRYPNATVYSLSIKGKSSTSKQVSQATVEVRLKNSNPVQVLTRLKMWVVPNLPPAKLKYYFVQDSRFLDWQSPNPYLAPDGTKIRDDVGGPGSMYGDANQRFNQAGVQMELYGSTEWRDVPYLGPPDLPYAAPYWLNDYLDWKNVQLMTQNFPQANFSGGDICAVLVHQLEGHECCYSPETKLVFIGYDNWDPGILTPNGSFLSYPYWGGHGPGSSLTPDALGRVATRGRVYSHELGHALLPTNNRPNKQGTPSSNTPAVNGWRGGHDFGPAPAGTDALMRADPLAKGEWLRHEDWRTAVLELMRRMGQ